MAAVAEATAQPWFFVRLVSAVPHPPLGGALAVGSVVLGLEAAVFVIGHRMGELPLQLDAQIIVDALTHAWLTAYIVAAGWWQQGAVELRSLRTVLDCTQQIRYDGRSQAANDLRNRTVALFLFLQRREQIRDSLLGERPEDSQS